MDMVYFYFQAFHWCPDHEAAAKEFARILKPDGVVAFIWNLEDRYVHHHVYVSMGNKD